MWILTSISYIQVFRYFEAFIWLGKTSISNQNKLIRKRLTYLEADRELWNTMVNGKLTGSYIALFYPEQSKHFTQLALFTHYMIFNHISLLTPNMLLSFLNRWLDSLKFGSLTAFSEWRLNRSTSVCLGQICVVRVPSGCLLSRLSGISG